MRVTIIITASLLALSGCQSPVDDMINNKFVTITPQSSPESLVGTWTGNMGPYLTSFKFNKDGNGLFCYSYGTADVIQKIKYNDKIVYIQDGTKLEVKSNTNNTLIVNASYFGSQQSNLIKDTNLSEASEFCANKFDTQL